MRKSQEAPHKARAFDPVPPFDVSLYVFCFVLLKEEKQNAHFGMYTLLKIKTEAGLQTALLSDTS